MKNLPVFRLWAPIVLLGAFSSAPLAAQAIAITSKANIQSLLESARAFDGRGRMDLASQNWQQVLAADPNSTEALGGLARASKLSGNLLLANAYLNRLRFLSPADPQVARVEGIASSSNPDLQLQQAAKLAQLGQYGEAMILYRQLFGNTPPPGNLALAFYETEFATEDGRPHAIAGLRTLNAKFPHDGRYAVALGRLLTYNPQTRGEGRTLLAAQAANADASEALRQSLLWEKQKQGASVEPNPTLANQRGMQVGSAIPMQAPAASDRNAERKASLAASAVPMHVPATAKSNSFVAMMDAGSRALLGNDPRVAEQRYRTALALRPASVEAREALGLALLKQGQPAAAIVPFMQATRTKPSSAPAWRGLFIAQTQAGDAARALGTELQMPASVRKELARDPEYLGTLAGAYAASGSDTDAQAAFNAALLLPFSADRQSLQQHIRLQYAKLLQGSGRLEQAASLYRQALNGDQHSVAAWAGLVATQHGLGKDSEALLTVHSMPPQIAAEAALNPDFASTIASIYQTQGRLDLAVSTLEKATGTPADAGQNASGAVQVQLAELYLQGNTPQRAFPIFLKVLSQDSTRVDAWKGLLGALHSTGHNAEALVQMEQIPIDARARLQNDAEFLQSMAAVYSTLGQTQQAQLYQQRIQQQLAVSGHAIVNPPLLGTTLRESSTGKLNQPAIAVPSGQDRSAPLIAPPVPAPSVEPSVLNTQPAEARSPERGRARAHRHGSAMQLPVEGSLAQSVLHKANVEPVSSAASTAAMPTPATFEKEQIVRLSKLAAEERLQVARESQSHPGTQALLQTRGPLVPKLAPTQIDIPQNQFSSVLQRAHFGQPLSSVPMSRASDLNRGDLRQQTLSHAKPTAPDAFGTYVPYRSASSPIAGLPANTSVGSKSATSQTQEELNPSAVNRSGLDASLTGQSKPPADDYSTPSPEMEQ